MNTDWYEPEQKPVRVGPYKRIVNYFPHFSFWNGEYFGLLADTPEESVLYRNVPSAFQKVIWSGLKEPA